LNIAPTLIFAAALFAQTAQSNTPANGIDPNRGIQSSPESTAYSHQPDIAAFIDELVQQDGFERSLLEQWFDQVQLKPHIIDILDRPATSKPYFEFRPNFVNATRIRAGVAWWHAHSQLVDAVSTKYGVDAQYLVAIVGVETMWGKNTGSFRVMDSLSTIAFGYPRRADYFRKELREFLLMAREEHNDPFSYRGSYAGAMGMPQFMPSSFHAFAQDWDGDGRHDIWNDAGDILASVANYFAQHGWVKGDPLVAPADVDESRIAPLVEDKFNLHYKVSELADYGVAPKSPISGDTQAVLVPLETAAGSTHYWLGLNNFYVITRYNRSTLYAMAVHELAEAMKTAYLDPRQLPPEPHRLAKSGRKKHKTKHG
jgi:membrane-bound lytic murein transglycosylase B